MTKRNMTGQDWQIHAVDDHPKDDNERAMRLQESVTLADEPGGHGRTLYALSQLLNAAACLVSHTKDIEKYQGGTGASARAFLIAEMKRAKESLGDYKL